jgi:hypothetical protein
MRSLPRIEVLAIVLSAALLGGAAADRLSLPTPQGAASYHASVRAAYLQVPERIGDWTSRDVPVPAEATAQLRPNLILSRQYTNAVTGRSLSFLLVQCADVRDLVPHYPPVCYPGRGLMVTGTTRRTFSADGISFEATEYEFDANTFQQANPLSVVNFMLLPTGQIAADMDIVREQIALPHRYFGAAQVQVVMDSGWGQSERDATVEQLLRAYRPVLDAILSGVEK